VVQWEVPPTRRLAFVVVLAVAALSVVLTIALHDFRIGGYVLAASLASAAVMRATLPEKYCLGLLVRSRRLDVTIDAVLAVGVFVGAQIVPS
jgi:hypothetical protein